MNKSKDADRPPVHAVVITPGAVIVNDQGHVHRSGDGVVCIYVDLSSKNCEYSGCSCGGDQPPEVFLSATEGTLGVDDSRTDEMTVIAFPSYPGWSVFAAEVSRYTLAVTLVDRS